MKLLCLLHTESDGSLGKPAREVITAALEVAGRLEGAEVSLGLAGVEVQAAADSVAGCEASAVYTASGPELGASRYATDTAAAAAVIRDAQPDVVLAPSTARLSRCLPGVAVRTGGRIDTHVTALEVANGEILAQRWFYRQRIVATLKRPHRPWFLAIQSGVFAPWEGAPGSASLTPVVVETSADELRTTVVGIEAPNTDTQSIRPDAELLFVAGAGWSKKQKDGQTHLPEAAEIIQSFLGTSQASLGSSKSLVDLQTEGQDVLPFMSHLNQVGQTGATPRHAKGLATCCHGEEPHVVGWRFINERRAVNLDPNCGWAQGKADVLYVADAFEVMREVNARLGG